MNRELDPIKFGWEPSDKKFRPVQGHEKICSRELFERLCCNCNTDYRSRRCSCKKANMSCTDICKCSDACLNKQHLCPTIE